MQETDITFLEIASRIRDELGGEISPKTFRYKFLAEPLTVITDNLLSAVSEVFGFRTAVLFLIEGDVLFMHRRIGDLAPEAVEFLESYRTWTSNRDNLLLHFLNTSAAPQILDLEHISAWLTPTEKEVMNVEALALVPIHRFSEPVGVLILVFDSMPQEDIAPSLKKIHALTELVADNLFFSLRMQARRTDEQWRLFLNDVIEQLDSESGKGNLVPFIMDRVIQLDKVDACAFFTRHGDEIILMDHRDMPSELVEDFHCALGEGYLGNVFVNAKYRFRGGAHKGVIFPDDNYFPPSTSFIHQPIIIDDQVKSVISIVSQGKVLLTRTEIVILKSLANHLSLALRFADLDKRRLSAPSQFNEKLDDIIESLAQVIHGRFGTLPNQAQTVLNNLAKQLIEIKSKLDN